MLFGTLEEYNKELAYMEKMLSRMEKRIQENSNEIGTQGNYNSMKYLYNHFSEDKQDFISMMNEINLKLKGNLVDNSLLVNNVSALNNKFNDINFVSTNILDSDFNSNQVLLVKEISEGSYNIKYAFPNPTEEDVMRESSRKKRIDENFQLYQLR